MGARSVKDARACYMAYLRRSVGICATRQNAVLKERALGICSGGNTSAKRRINVELGQRTGLTAGILIMFVSLLRGIATCLIGERVENAPSKRL